MIMLPIIIFQAMTLSHPKFNRHFLSHNDGKALHRAPSSKHL